jgi:adenylylsulfate reductase, subunit B
MPPVVDDERCALCGVCQDVCPGDILHIDGGIDGLVRYGDECQHCGICVIECPEDALSIRFPWEWLQTSNRSAVPL